jgi:hypothetical protein
LFKSYRLPLVTNKLRPAIRVAQATDVPYGIILRTIGPAGGWAVFAYNASELDGSNTNTPMGDVLILPTFQWQFLTLKPRQVIYAKGGVADTLISVTFSELDDEDYSSELAG